MVTKGLPIGVTIYRLSPVVWLAVQLATRLVVETVSTIGVAGYTRVLQAVLIALVVWFKVFLALYRLARALI